MGECKHEPHVVKMLCGLHPLRSPFHKSGDNEGWVLCSIT